MTFSVDYKNNLWKIKISNSIDKTLGESLIKQSFLYVELDREFIFSFESISDFTDACCNLRDHGYYQ